MTIRFSIEAANPDLSKMVAASLRGEDVVLSEKGQAVARIVPIGAASDRPALTLEERQARAQKRVANIGKWRDAFEGYDTDPEPSMTDEEVEAKARRIFGPAD